MSLVSSRTFANTTLTRSRITTCCHDLRREKKNRSALLHHFINWECWPVQFSAPVHVWIRMPQNSFEDPMKDNNSSLTLLSREKGLAAREQRPKRTGVGAYFYFWQMSIRLPVPSLRQCLSWQGMNANLLRRWGLSKSQHCLQHIPPRRAWSCP